MADRQRSQTGAAISGTSVLREINAHAILDRLRSDGPLTRAELARRTALSKPTVSTTLAELEAIGLARETGDNETGRRGPQAALYEANPTAGYVIGIDIGRQWLRVAVADLAGAVCAVDEQPNRARTAPKLVRDIDTLARRVASDGGVAWHDVQAITVASPGVLDASTRRMRLAWQLPGWDSPSLIDQLNGALGSTVALENDINLAAIGELHFGAARGARNFVFISIGTGVGMGLVVDGQLHRGARGAAGEIGYIPDPCAVLPKTAHDVSQPGAFERAASASGVVDDAIEHGVVDVETALDVFRLASEGNRRAIGVIDRLAVRLGAALSTVSALLDPEFIVLGGGVGSNTEQLRSTVERTMTAINPVGVPIVASQLPGQAIVMGAIAASLQQARDRVFAMRALPRSVPVL